MDQIDFFNMSRFFLICFDAVKVSALLHKISTSLNMKYFDQEIPNKSEDQNIDHLEMAD